MTRTKSVKALLVVLMSAALIIAFMPQTAFTSYAATAKKVKSVTRSYPTTSSAYTMKVGQSKTFRVRLNPKNLKSTSKTTFWYTSKSSVGTLAKSKYSTKYKKYKGYYYAYTTVKAVKAGTTTVTAKSKYGPKASWKVTVQAATALTGVTLSKTKGVMVGDELTATAAPSATSVEYQWYADDVAIDGATANTYTVVKANIGKKLTVKATGLGKYTGTVTSDATEAVVEGKITAATVKLPTTDQTNPYVGDVLTAETTPATTLCTYQWYRGTDTTTPIVGAVSKTYTTVAADKGSAIHVIVTAIKDSGVTGTADSAVTGVVVDKLTSVNITSNSTAGAVKDAVLTANVYDAAATLAKTALTEDKATYQWYADGVAITASGTGHTYTVTEANAGKSITVKATGAVSKGYGGSVTSAAAKASVKVETVKLGTGDTPDTAEWTAGAPAVGTQFYAIVNGMTAKVQSEAKTLTYEWRANGVAISGAANKSTFTATAAQKGKVITCLVTGSDNYSDSMVSTTAVTEVSATAQAIASVSISSTNADHATPVIGDTLQAVTSPAAAKDAVTYQWYKNIDATTASACNDADKIAGATSSTYTPSDADVTAGYKYSVKITKVATDTDFGDVTTPKATSVALSLKLGTVTISDTTAVAANRTTVLNTDALTLVLPKNQHAAATEWYIDTPAAANQIYKKTSGADPFTFGTKEPVTGESIVLQAKNTSTVGTAQGQIKYVDANGNDLDLVGHTIYAKVIGSGDYAGSTTSAVTAVKVTKAVAATDIQVKAKAGYTDNQGTLTVVNGLITSGTSAKVGDRYTASLTAGETGTVAWYTRTGTTAATYVYTKVSDADLTVTGAVVSKDLYLGVTGTGDYSGTAYMSAAVTPVAGTIALTKSVETAQIGSTVSVSVVPADATVTYQWYKDDVAINNATTSSYTITQADYDTMTTKITCKVIGNTYYVGSDATVGWTKAQLY